MENTQENTIESFDNEQSIENQISSLLNDDLTIMDEPVQTEPESIEQSQTDDAVKPKQEQPKQENRYRVKINGEEREVELDELIKGYQRQSDYTSKTQELSQQRKELEESQRQYQTYLQSIPMLGQVAQANIQEAQARLYSKEFIDMADSDPVNYVKEKARLEQVIAQNQSAAEQMAQHWQAFQGEQTRIQQEYFKQQLLTSNEILSKEIEGWSEGAVIPQLREYATKSIGFQPEELENLIDYRQVIVLNKARLYDQMMAEGRALDKKVKTVVPKTLSASAASEVQSDQTEYIKERNRVLKSNDDRAIAALMAKML